MSKTNGRDRGGRFTAGNKGGPGRPRRAFEEGYRTATIATVSIDDWAAIVAKAREQAKAGNDKARAWLTKVLGIDVAESLPAISISDPANAAPVELLEPEEKPCDGDRVAWLQRIAGQIRARATERQAVDCTCFWPPRE